MSNKPIKIIALLVLLTGLVGFSLDAKAYQVNFSMSYSPFGQGHAISAYMPYYGGYGIGYGQSHWGYVGLPNYFYHFVSRSYQPNVAYPVANPFDKIRHTQNLAMISEVKKEAYFAMKEQNLPEPDILPLLQPKPQKQELPQINIEENRTEYQPKESHVADGGSVKINLY